MTLNSKNKIQKLKTKNQRCRNKKNQNTEKRESSFTKKKKKKKKAENVDKT